MARKKPLQYVPLEERPNFLALVAELANVPAEQFPGAAMQCAEKYHDAVLAGHVEVLDQMEAAYKALVFKLNGDTMFGCGADDDSAANVLCRSVAAKPGQVPRWGQAGDFLLEVEGLRVRVVLSSNMLGNHLACALHAVDLDKPFISTTGYRSAGLTVASNLGETVDQAARRLVLDLIQEAGRLKPIEADALARKRPEKVPGWLVDALAGVRPDGQLAMFGDAPSDPYAKAPLSNAARQKAFRQRQRELKEQQGAKSVLLTRDDLRFLYVAVDGFNTARADLEYLSADRYRESLTRVFKGSPLWTEDFFERLGHDQGILNGEKRREAERKRGWQAYEDERKRTDRLYDELAQVKADNQRLQDTLQEIAAELGGAAPAPVKPGQLETLTQQVAALQKEQTLLETERNKAFAANRTLTERLRRAGLPTDYRPQPGE